MMAWLVPLTAMLVTLLLTPLVRRLVLAHGLVDKPGNRRSHSLPTPRGGGLALVAGLSVSLIIAAPLGHLTGSTGYSTLLLIALLGLLGGSDDVFELGVGVRLACQVLIASVMLLVLGGVGSITVAGIDVHQPFLFSGLALVAVVWLINLHNFMDGSDGLAAMQASWTGLMFGWIFWRDFQLWEMLVRCSVLAGAALGVLSGTDRWPGSFLG